MWLILLSIRYLNFITKVILFLDIVTAKLILRPNKAEKRYATKWKTIHPDLKTTLRESPDPTNPLPFVALFGVLLLSLSLAPPFLFRGSLSLRHNNLLISPDLDRSQYSLSLPLSAKPNFPSFTFFSPTPHCFTAHSHALPITFLSFFIY